MLRELEELSYKEISADRGRAHGDGDVAPRARARPAAAAAARSAQEETLVNCTRLRQVLDAWIDGELDHATGAEIGSHLDACPACASLRRERDELRAQRASWCAVSQGAGGSFAPRVRRRLAAADAPSAPRQRPSWLQAAALACAAALVSALAGYWIGRPAPDSTAARAGGGEPRRFARPRSAI